MTFKEVIKRLREDGWVEKLPGKKGSHRQFIHPEKPGKVAIPEYPGNIKQGTLKNIERQTGVTLH